MTSKSFSVQVTPNVTRRDVVEVAIIEDGIQLATFTHVLRFGAFPHFHLRECGFISYELVDVNFNKTVDSLTPKLYKG